MKERGVGVMTYARHFDEQMMQVLGFLYLTSHRISLLYQKIEIIRTGMGSKDPPKFWKKIYKKRDRVLFITTEKMIEEK